MASNSQFLVLSSWHTNSSRFVSPSQSLADRFGKIIDVSVPLVKKMFSTSDFPSVFLHTPSRIQLACMEAENSCWLSYTISWIGLVTFCPVSSFLYIQLISFYKYNEQILLIRDPQTILPHHLPLYFFRNFNLLCFSYQLHHSGSYNEEIHEMTEARAFGMGQYSHNNQPVSQDTNLLQIICLILPHFISK